MLNRHPYFTLGYDGQPLGLHGVTYFPFVLTFNTLNL